MPWCLICLCRQSVCVFFLFAIPPSTLSTCRSKTITRFVSFHAPGVVTGSWCAAGSSPLWKIGSASPHMTPIFLTGQTPVNFCFLSAQKLLCLHSFWLLDLLCTKLCPSNHELNSVLQEVPDGVDKIWWKKIVLSIHCWKSCQKRNLPRLVLHRRKHSLAEWLCKYYAKALDPHTAERRAFCHHASYSR